MTGAVRLMLVVLLSGCRVSGPILTSLGGEVPIANELCPATYHDNVTVLGPDGSPYPTWHPPTDVQTGCLFGHEHGDDPTTSSVDPALPAFGYAARLAGMFEPHEGYKVFVIHAGSLSNNGTPADAHHRVVFHMGTSELSRYSVRYHSLEYDYATVDASGRAFSVMGMADTGVDAGSVCNQVGAARFFATLGCATQYETWRFRLDIVQPGNATPRLMVGGGMAAFDPVTTRDPSDNSRQVYTLDVFFPNSGVDPRGADSWIRGCNRELYTGRHRFENAGGPTTYETDAYGFEVPNGTPGALLQTVSAIQSTQDTFLLHPRNFCADGVRAPN
ncbi:MAG: hypothetical protein ACKVPX_11475 [Myxococcaceae bacterium]